MPRAVQYDQFGSVDVLHIAEVAQPEPRADQVVVEVVAAGINPGEVPVREGVFAEQWPTAFPSGQGSDLAGRIAAVGAAVTGVEVGDEVIGFSDERSSQADFAAIPGINVTPKPADVGWDAAGALFVVGTTAYAAVRAVAPTAEDTVVVSGAAGGVGSVVVQLARHTGATVLGIASAANADWLGSLGVQQIAYGDGLEQRIREAAPDGVDALIDTFGGGYVKLAHDLGVDADRIDTIADFAAAQELGAKTDGNAAANEASVLAELADLIAAGRLEIPIAATYPLEQVRDAYTELAARHTHGKIVLRLR